MRLSHILQLGIKELRGLARDPMLLALIVYSFTLSIYTTSRAIPETLQLQKAIDQIDPSQPKY